MTEEIVKNGFWNVPEFNHLNYDTITEIDEYKPTQKLPLLITQINKSSYQQKKLVDEWCKFLPTLTEPEIVWLPSRVNQQIFDALCEMKNLKCLWIKWSGVKNIKSLSKLNKLEHLHLGSAAQVESIAVLKNLTSLITLELEQLNKIKDFSIISELTQLKGLGIDGSIWTAQKIENLGFLEPLQNLEYFTMTNSQLNEKNFDVLLKLPNLKRFSTSWNNPESEFEKLKQLPNLKYGNVETSWKEIKAKLDKQL